MPDSDRCGATRVSLHSLPPTGRTNAPLNTILSLASSVIIGQSPSCPSSHVIERDIGRFSIPPHVDSSTKFEIKVTKPLSEEKILPARASERRTSCVELSRDRVIVKQVWVHFLAAVQFPQAIFHLADPCDIYFQYSSHEDRSHTLARYDRRLPMSICFAYTTTGDANRFTATKPKHAFLSTVRSDRFASWNRPDAATGGASWWWGGETLLRPHAQAPPQHRQYSAPTSKMLARRFAMLALRLAVTLHSSKNMITSPYKRMPACVNPPKCLVASLER
ncbi:hypothetical protein LSTR_LSTR010068 [Laodelphax striatellus]|uniref:Uncharacterized protein n=1 Tax=Laodelphax striatellus TaxID=195883 RepID=A0A482WNW0_LAOST|nr:hypothetical protein LSTR_LSTR010068 [Laodelphax striatellus]